MFWRGNIESHLNLQAIISLHQLVILKDTWKTQFLNFMKPRRIIELWPLQICLETLSIYIHLKMWKNLKLDLGHVLIQMKCCLCPVILSSFHRRGRRHYIRAIKMFDRKPSMPYTIIVKSLIHCWDNSEQNAMMLARC